MQGGILRERLFSLEKKAPKAREVFRFAEYSPSGSEGSGYAPVPFSKKNLLWNKKYNLPQKGRLEHLNIIIGI